MIHASTLALKAAVTRQDGTAMMSSVQAAEHARSILSHAGGCGRRGCEFGIMRTVLLSEVDDLLTKARHLLNAADLSMLETSKIQ